MSNAGAPVERHWETPGTPDNKGISASATARMTRAPVRAHIGNIMRKYRLQNRTQIAMTLAVTSSPNLLGDESAA